MKISKLLWEARRRKVFRGAGLYIVASWLLLQIGDVVTEPLGLPDWSMTALLYTIFLCFPVAIFLDWRYDITPRGIVRTKRVRGETEALELDLGIKDYLIFCSLLVIVAIGVYGIYLDKDSFPVESNVAVDQQQSGDANVRPALPNSIAVLPFQDMSAGGDQEYFADGLADAVLHLLAKIKGLRVAARTSSFAFKENNLSVIEIASKLGVEKILEGSVYRVDNRLRVIAKLIEVKNGTQLWSERFDGTVDDVFDIQDQIANQVVDAMQVIMSATEVESIEDRYRPTMAAYDQGVLGMFAKSKGDVANLKQAQIHFEKAIEIDPNYALPYIYLAETFGLLEVYALGYQDTFSGVPTEFTRSKQEPLIRKALELDPENGEAFAALASIQIDDELAKQEFEKAIELNPSYANSYLWYSKYLSIRRGEYERAQQQIDLALELDPLSDQVLFERAKMIWASGQAERAMTMMKANVKRSPHYPPYYKRIARWHSQLGDLAEAGRWIIALRKLDPNSPSHWGEWAGECWIYARLQANEELEKCQNEFIEAYPDSVTAKRIKAEAFGLEESANVMKTLYLNEPGNDYRANQYASILDALGHHEEVLEVMEEAHPQLFLDEPKVNGETTWPATLGIIAYQNLDQPEKADKLLDKFEETISKIRLIAGPGFTNGFENVELAALRGNKKQALDELQKTVNQGWRFMWDMLPYITSLKTIHNEPRFKKIMADLQEDIKVQRERFFATKDQPLF